MIKNKIVVLGLCLIFVIGIAIPTDKAQAFSFGDIQNQISILSQKINQLWQLVFNNNPVPHCGDGRTQCVWENESIPDSNSVKNNTIPVATENNTFNPEKTSIAGCKNEGETVDNSKNQKCCAGLAPLKVVKLGNGTSCSDEISGYVCAKCGDRICGNGENKCNCVQDCGKDTDESAKKMTCDQACKSLGYQASYCNAFTWKRMPGATEAYTADYCNKGDDSLNGHWLSDTDCTNMGDAQKNISGKQCCCKGEPVNNASCPKIEWPNAPTMCIEESGWMKNPKTSECCWYKATCYGPDWTAYRTKEECQNPCEFDKNKLACCRNGICNAITLKCGTANELDTDWTTCDDQCKPVASCKPKTDIWDTCDKLCQKSNLGKVTDCIANKGRSIVNPENGYGCCCEKTVCGQEGEKLAMDKGQQCCADLKQITVTNTGIDFLCVNPADQKTGSPCESNDDCASGYICLNNFASPERKCAKKPT